MILAEVGLGEVGGIGAAVVAVLGALFLLFGRRSAAKAAERKQKADALRDENEADQVSLQEQIEGDIEAREKDRRARANYDAVRDDLRKKLKRSPSTTEIVAELRRRRDS